jgi:hypothetical protein
MPAADSSSWAAVAKGRTTKPVRKRKKKKERALGRGGALRRADATAAAAAKCGSSPGGVATHQRARGLPHAAAPCGVHVMGLCVSLY